MQEKSQIFKLVCKQCEYTCLVETEESPNLHISFLCPDCGYAEILALVEPEPKPKKVHWIDYVIRKKPYIWVLAFFWFIGFCPASHLLVKLRKELLQKRGKPL